MRKIIFAIPLALMLAAPAANSGTAEVKLSEKDQAKFEKLVSGRTAGKPVSCINRIDQGNMTAVGDKYLVYSRSSRAKTIYVNEPYGGCRDVDRHALVTVRPSAQLCRGEIAQVKDLPTGAFIDSCSFSSFVPYTETEG
ncbi:hypothetical protein [Parasphingorhabdus cellanae]|uniref:Uncharacterized protein n=1 Tax=Parasphingorhabdus cellanae TaxID=2806553 RepID=A0ABX7T6A6_9SPHN|nr:hypothetical protein [Parasphingorhabdus cellanae]QTD57144.1 hypothetical protein J4G78_06235 [Parasphingorhabdus cellanae]